MANSLKIKQKVYYPNVYTVEGDVSSEEHYELFLQRQDFSLTEDNFIIPDFNIRPEFCVNLGTDLADPYVFTVTHSGIDYHVIEVYGTVIMAKDSSLRGVELGDRIPAIKIRYKADSQDSWHTYYYYLAGEGFIRTNAISKIKEILSYNITDVANAQSAIWQTAFAPFYLFNTFSPRQFIKVEVLSDATNTFNGVKFTLENHTGYLTITSPIINITGTVNVLYGNLNESDEDGRQLVRTFNLPRYSNVDLINEVRTVILEQQIETLNEVVAEIQEIAGDVANRFVSR